MNTKTPTKHKRHTSGMYQSDISLSDVVRFCKLVTTGRDPEKCWTFDGYKNAQGYGRFRFCGDKRGSHVFSYLAFVGDIRERHEIDHKCGNRNCCNPKHLEQVTKKENLDRRKY